ncbi:MAG: SDR family NAD(P)-dependent oxidoreductase [Betaproteobacteria bacterium]|nr:SDR family NAD(P)-dependent oxidoreductase [Betaproteobacteria bacterium]
MTQDVAVIVGVGKGLSASLARLFHGEGMAVALAARKSERMAELCGALPGAKGYVCDASDAASVAGLFEAVERDLSTPSLVVFNAGMRGRGPVAELDVEQVRVGLMNGAFAGFLVGQQAARRMLPKGRGSILFTGATASVKGFAQSAPFAMAKFALRGLAQSMARELAPQGLHVAHIVIDGGIATTYSKDAADRATDRWLDPDAIAQTYLQLHRQHRSTWTWEVEVRPWVEKF